MSYINLSSMRLTHPLQNAMNVVGLAKEEQDEIFKMLAIILWLGNVQFVEGDDGNSAIADTDGE